MDLGRMAAQSGEGWEREKSHTVKEVTPKTTDDRKLIDYELSFTSLGMCLSLLHTKRSPTMQRTTEKRGSEWGRKREAREVDIHNQWFLFKYIWIGTWEISERRKQNGKAAYKKKQRKYWTRRGKRKKKAESGMEQRLHNTLHKQCTLNP